MDIFIIDKDAGKLAMLDAEYNLMAVVGDGTAFSILRQAEVDKCELFIAVTDVAHLTSIWPDAYQQTLRKDKKQL
jgi:Trk K+ transport system NAD-binding subunit